jgi:hypothetical protein
MTACKPVHLSSEALDRIRRAAGGWPANLKLSDLGQQLSKAIYEYHSFLALRDIKTQKARLRAIHKTASKLAVLLRTDEENGILEWHSQWPKDLPPASKVAEEIQRMAQESGVLEMSPRKIIREIKDDNAVLGGALEWLLSRKLPEVFEHFFRRDVTLYPKGHYVRFALQVIAECGIGDVKPSTIIRALTDARSGRSRRRHSGKKVSQENRVSPTVGKSN